MKSLVIWVKSSLENMKNICMGKNETIKTFLIEQDIMKTSNVPV